MQLIMPKPLEVGLKGAWMLTWVHVCVCNSMGGLESKGVTGSEIVPEKIPLNILKTIATIAGKCSLYYSWTWAMCKYVYVL